MKEVHIANALLLLGYCSMTIIISWCLYPFFIRIIKKLKMTQKIRTSGLSGGKLFAELHAHKSGTPTMGGLVIILAILTVIFISHIASLIGFIDQSLLSRSETYLPVFTLVVVGFLGLLDDWFNVVEKNKHKGLSAKTKMATLVIFAIAAVWWFVVPLERSFVEIPFVGSVDFGYWYIPFFMFVFLGTTNAVNITDGLDGLAGGLLAIAYGVFGVLAYFYGLYTLSAFCFVVVAALMGFLWFNVPPALIYMGDTGSLSLGAALAVISFMVDNVFVLITVSVVFIIETLSVLLQLFWKKYFKRKLFLIAPVHHHFEKKGLAETQIMLRFWIIGILGGITGLVIGILN